MIKLLNEGKTIEYTQGDTFELVVSGEEAVENTMLRFVISADEASSPIIDEQYQYSDERFVIVLTSNERERLPIGNYIFKISLIDVSGRVITYLSGDLIVKWGV